MNAFLIWIDIETGGLSGLLPGGQMGCSYYPILEVAVIITDSQLKEVGDPLQITIHHDDAVIGRCHEWALDTHAKSGLLDRCRASTISLAQAEELILCHLKNNGVAAYDRKAKTGGLMAGNSILLDRMFISAQMPSLNAYLNYRQLDASAVALAARYWAPKLATAALEHKTYSHEALSDIRESIAEARVYMNFLQLNSNH
jgi:oligoribonuclease (3'-5' exoribonuclease)